MCLCCFICWEKEEGAGVIRNLFNIIVILWGGRVGCGYVAIGCGHAISKSLPTVYPSFFFSSLSLPLRMMKTQDLFRLRILMVTSLQLIRYRRTGLSFNPFVFRCAPIVVSVLCVSYLFIFIMYAYYCHYYYYIII